MKDFMSYNSPFKYKLKYFVLLWVNEDAMSIYLISVFIERHFYDILSVFVSNLYLSTVPN
jgi:hypothetical protein